MGLFLNGQEYINRVLRAAGVEAGDISAGNYTALEEGCVMYGTHTRWDDERLPFTQTRQGALAKPDFDYDEVAYLFPQNNTAEKLYGLTQMPHKWKVSSDIDFHIHFKQTETTAPTFKVDYRWFNIGDPVPATFTTVVLDQQQITYDDSGKMHQILSSSSLVNGTDKTISSKLQFKIYRDDNDITGDVTAWEFDLHYQVDSQGSREEYVK